jgi:hypothetical protein
MRRWPRWIGAACCAAFVLVVAAMPLAAEPPAMPPGQPWTGSGVPPGLVAPCDQYDPFGPARSTRIALDSRDFVHQDGSEMRSFIDTGSIGKVDVAVVAATPPGIVRGISAVPEISRMSPYFGERLKGVALDVALATTGQPVQIVLDLRQVCATHFSDTFLYY